MTSPTTITVTGTYQDLAQNALSGRVIFQATIPVQDSNASIIFSDTPIVAALDDDGSFSQVLPCTDTTGTTAFYYVVTEQVTNLNRTYDIQLPHTLGGTADLSALAPVVGPPAATAFTSNNTWTGTQTFSSIVLTGSLAPSVVDLAQSGGAVAVNAAAGNDFRLTLTASGWEIANPSNATDGQVIEFALAQDPTGNRTVSWGTAYDFGTDGAPALSTGASKVDLIGFKYHGGLSKWLCLGAGLGY